ncbi:hypothetical protein GCM10010869_28270 [Mesorhizobium tianshanense]|nr:hypothetical protein GCM10010869_28270 [Mesorhizobium tianshanense]
MEARSKQPLLGATHRLTKKYLQRVPVDILNRRCEWIVTHILCNVIGSVEDQISQEWLKRI